MVMEQLDTTRQALAEQLAYYFSDDNLVTDEYLQWHFACHGWELPLLMVAPFKLVDRYLSGELELDPYITHTFDGVEATNDAFHALESGDCLRAVVVY